MKKIIPIISVIVIIIVIVGSCFLYNYTEVFGKKLIPIKITSANISYIPGVNKDIVDSEGNSIVPLENIKISSKDLKVLSKKVKTIKKLDGKIKDNSYIATLIINNNYKIYIGEKNGYIENKKNKVSIAIPNSLYNYVYDICNKNNSKLFKKVEVNSINVSSNGAKINISSEKNIDAIKSSINYLDINLNDEYSTYNNGYKYTLTINENKTILLYDNNVGYTNIDCEDGMAKYVVFEDNFYEVIDKIFKISVESSEK